VESPWRARLAGTQAAKPGQVHRCEPTLPTAGGRGTRQACRRNVQGSRTTVLYLCSYQNRRLSSCLYSAAGLFLIDTLGLSALRRGRRACEKKGNERERERDETAGQGRACGQCQKVLGDGWDGGGGWMGRVMGWDGIRWQRTGANAHSR
jgi:hypothetical protein